MDINIDKQSKAVIVAVKGRMDAVSAPEFQSTMADYIAAGENRFVVDCSDLEYISSAGLRSVFKARRAMEAKRGTLLLVNVQPQVQKVFDIVKALPSNSVFKTVAELDQYLDYMQRKV